jgi:tRNA(Ile2) C34 agmatinyltransferase TiaS
LLRIERSLGDKTLSRPRATLVEVKTLRPHEDVDTHHLEVLRNQIRADGKLKFAIAVDKDTKIILDGHHRSTALAEIGCDRIPAIIVDYRAPHIKVQSWRNDWQVTKEMVIEAGLSGKKLPPRTSRHMILANGKLQHMVTLETRVDFPLTLLKG